jgi:hypothetical protein
VPHPRSRRAWQGQLVALDHGLDRREPLEVGPGGDPQHQSSRADHDCADVSQVKSVALPQDRHPMGLTGMQASFPATSPDGTRLIGRESGAALVIASKAQILQFNAATITTSRLVPSCILRLRMQRGWAVTMSSTSCVNSGFKRASSVSPGANPAVGQHLRHRFADNITLNVSWDPLTFRAQ